MLLELYERFFKVALKKEAERLGIVYTPVEVVDFILHSADHALQQHFGRRLTGEDVHILDPFTGTGTFIVRLLQNQDLIQCEDLVRKFQSELHANEIVLLAYYIAAINIEEAYHGRRGMETAYAPFSGIVFTDTFTLGEDEGQLPRPSRSTASGWSGSRAGTLRSLWAILRIQRGKRVLGTTIPMCFIHTWQGESKKPMRRVVRPDLRRLSMTAISWRFVGPVTALRSRGDCLCDQCFFH